MDKSWSKSIKNSKDYEEYHPLQESNVYFLTTVIPSFPRYCRSKKSAHFLLSFDFELLCNPIQRLGKYLRDTLIKTGDDKNFVWTKVAPNPSRIHKTTKNMILCKNLKFTSSLTLCFFRYCGLMPLKKWPCTSLL